MLYGHTCLINIYIFIVVCGLRLLPFWIALHDGRTIFLGAKLFTNIWLCTHGMAFVTPAENSAVTSGCGATIHETSGLLMHTISVQTVDECWSLFVVVAVIFLLQSHSVEFMFLLV